MVVATVRGVVGFFKSKYRNATTTMYDVYDTIESGQIASMRGTCVFCDIIVDGENRRDGAKNEIWFEDDDVVVFSVRTRDAKVHGLIVPKRHIRDINHLKPEDLPLL